MYSSVDFSLLDLPHSISNCLIRNGFANVVIFINCALKNVCHLLNRDKIMTQVIENSIVEKLTIGLTPSHLSVENESYMHNVPPGSESHFKVVVVSEQFETKRLVQRHQLVYKCVQEELANSVHALAIHAYTPQEWQKQGIAPDSPKCMGKS